MKTRSDYSEEFRINIARDMIENNLSYRAAAKKYDIDHRTAGQWKKKYRHQIEYGIKDDQSLKAVSELSSWRDEDGNYHARWVKTNIEHEEAISALKEVADGLIEDITPAKPTKITQKTNSDLLALYVLSDFHIGMYAEKEQSGDDWDHNKAEQTLYKWIDMAVSLSPDAHTGVFLNLGDLLHANGAKPVTPHSGHALDVSASYGASLMIAVKAIRYGISEMLKKHEHVHLINCLANHDPDVNECLQTMFYFFYQDEPRVTIDMTKTPFYSYEWGDTSLFMHHGDKRNINNVSQVFAGMYRDIFGRTKYSYGHLGHFHHTSAKEDSLMQIQIHPTLAAKDKYASHHGYLSQRKARTIIYSKKYGEVGSVVITPDMLGT